MNTAHVRAAVVAVLLTIAALVVTTSSASAQPTSARTYAEGGGLRVSATIDGHDVGSASSSQPIRLVPDDTVSVAVMTTNTSARPVDIGQIDLRGRVLGMDFFVYSVGTDVTLAPGTTQVIRYRLHLVGLAGQATGLMSSQLVVRTPGGAALATVATVTDVRGSLFSVYGLFGLALAILTLLALVDTAVRVARHRLPRNRWRRGLYVMISGIGVGLLSGFAVSVLRLAAPGATVWVCSVIVCAAVFFTLGYLAPVQRTGRDDAEENIDDLDNIDELDDLDGFVDDGTASPAPATVLGRAVLDRGSSGSSRDIGSL